MKYSYKDVPTPAYIVDKRLLEDNLKILNYVQEGLDQGALGIGINAGYAPGYGQKEYYALAQMAADHVMPSVWKCLSGFHC